MTRPHQLVVDTSVLIKFVVPEKETPAVQQFLNEVFTDDKSVLHIPDLFYIECANILWKKVLRDEVDEQIAAKCLRVLASLGLTFSQSTC